MKFERVYDSCYSSMILGYKFDGGFISKDVDTNWNGNELVRGWSVEVNQKYCLFDGKRVFYADTLKEAKQYVKDNY